jgi:hypothetical protein
VAGLGAAPLTAVVGAGSAVAGLLARWGSKSRAIKVTSPNLSAAFEARLTPLSARLEGFLVILGNPGAREAVRFELARLA